MKIIAHDELHGEDAYVNWQVRVKVSARSAAMWLYWICGVAVLFAVGRAIDKRQQEPYPGEPSRVILDSDLHEALSSVDGTAISEVSSFHRGQATGLRQTISLHSSLSASTEKIDKTMSKLGWTRVEEKNKRGTVYLKFCKEDIAAIFEGIDTFLEQRFHVGVVWSDDPKHYAFCGK